jgi:hypothetical protein
MFAAVCSAFGLLGDAITVSANAVVCGTVVLEPTAPPESVTEERLGWLVTVRQFLTATATTTTTEAEAAAAVGKVLCDERPLAAHAQCAAVLLVLRQGVPHVPLLVQIIAGAPNTHVVDAILDYLVMHDAATAVHLAIAQNEASGGHRCASRYFCDGDDGTYHTGPLRRVGRDTVPDRFFCNDGAAWRYHRTMHRLALAFATDVETCRELEMARITQGRPPVRALTRVAQHLPNESSVQRWRAFGGPVLLYRLTVLHWQAHTRDLMDLFCNTKRFDRIAKVFRRNMRTVRASLPDADPGTTDVAALLHHTVRVDIVDAKATANALCAAAFRLPEGATAGVIDITNVVVWINPKWPKTKKVDRTVTIILDAFPQGWRDDSEPPNRGSLFVSNALLGVGALPPTITFLCISKDVPTVQELAEAWADTALFQHQMPPVVHWAVCTPASAPLEDAPCASMHTVHGTSHRAIEQIVGLRPIISAAPGVSDALTEGSNGDAAHASVVQDVDNICSVPTGKRLHDDLLLALVAMPCANEQ